MRVSLATMGVPKAIIEKYTVYFLKSFQRAVVSGANFEKYTKIGICSKKKYTDPPPEFISRF